MTNREPSTSPASSDSQSAPDENSKKIIELIGALEKSRNSRILCYIVSTRQGTNFQIGDDATRIIYNQLSKLEIKKDDKIDLFLHSNGGTATVPWKLANLIREFTSNFEVIVPYKAYSAATLIALGANKILMHRMGELGPVDPKVTNEFNPITQQGIPIGINVEDVASYVSFIKDFVGVRHEDELIQSLNALTHNVHPLALGNVHRFYSQSRMMARKLLKLHMRDVTDEYVIDEIVETLTSKLFFHGHPINRKEAEELKLKIEYPAEDIEKQIWDLYLGFEKLMEMDSIFNVVDILNNSGQQSVKIKLCGACVTSQKHEDRFVSELEILRPPVPQNIQPQLQVQYLTAAITKTLGSKWECIR